MGNPLTEYGRWDNKDGEIFYKIYQQDGTFQKMSCPDTQHNRQFVSWVQAYDRWPNGVAAVPFQTTRDYLKDPRNGI